MDKGFHLSIRASADFADVSDAELAPHDDPLGAQLARKVSAISGRDGHLGGCMDGQRGRDTPDQCGHAYILQRGRVACSGLYAIVRSALKGPQRVRCCIMYPPCTSSTGTCYATRCVMPETSNIYETSIIYETCLRHLSTCRMLIMSVYLDDDSICAAGCNGSDSLLSSLQLLIKEQDVEGHISLHAPLVQISHDLPLTEPCSVSTTMCRGPGHTHMRAPACLCLCMV